MIKTSRLIACVAAAGAAWASQSEAALVAHYTFDTDGTATVGTDATLGDAASIDSDSGDFVAGGGSLSLSGAPTTDGSGDDGAVGGDSFNWGTGGFESDVRTLTFFVKAGTQADLQPTMISLGSGTGGGNRFDVRLDGGNLRLEVQSGGSTSSSNLGDGKWYHVAIVVPNATSTVSDVQYYINGAYVGNFSNAQSINTGTGPLRVGDSYQDANRDFVGNIDDVRLYNEALDLQTIQALAAVPEPGSLALLGLGGLACLRRRRK